MPIVEEKVIVKEVEKLITEKPTHIHHIELETPEQPSGIPPVFLEEAPSTGWPWWLFLIPLLCLIPCLALLCCRKKKPAPIVRPKQPMAPVVAKPLARPAEKQIMHIKTEERHSPERKFVIEKKVVDEAEDIEKEITKELQKSRVVRESRAAREVSHGRQTAYEIAAESAMNRGSGGGRRKRIKTIKKHGEIVGREIQYLDEDGMVIRSERVGLDENEARIDHIGHTEVGVDRVDVVGSSGTHFIRGPTQDHLVKETYERETRGVEPTSSQLLVEGNRGRRGYSSTRHYDAAGYNSGSHAGLVEGDGEYGRYSPGGTRMSRVSRASRASGGGFREARAISSGSGRHREITVGGDGIGGGADMRIGTSGVGGGFRVGRSGSRGSRGSGGFRETREYKITGGGSTQHRGYIQQDDDFDNI